MHVPALPLFVSASFGRWPASRLASLPPVASRAAGSQPLFAAGLWQCCPVSAVSVAPPQIPLHVFSYKDLYGWTMDEIVREIGTRSNCTFCGVFRRQVRRRPPLPPMRKAPREEGPRKAGPHPHPPTPPHPQRMCVPHAVWLTPCAWHAGTCRAWPPSLAQEEAGAELTAVPAAMPPHLPVTPCRLWTAAPPWSRPTKLRRDTTPTTWPRRCCSTSSGAMCHGELPRGSAPAAVAARGGAQRLQFCHLPAAQCCTWSISRLAVARLRQRSRGTLPACLPA